MKYIIEAKSVGADTKSAMFTVQDRLDSIQIEIHSNDNKVNISTDVLDKLIKLIAIKEQQ